MPQITLRQLKDLTLFECIEDKTLDLMRECVITKKLKKSQILFSERQTMDNIYIVLDGKVTMYRLSEKGQKRVIYILNKGEMINEVVFDNYTASINCEGFEDSEIISISKVDLLNIMQQDFKLTEVILYSGGERLMDINTKLLKKNAYRIAKIRGKTAIRIRVPGGQIAACVGANVCPFANYNTTEFAKKIE